MSAPLTYTITAPPVTAQTADAARRQQDAVASAVAAVQDVFDTLPPDDLKLLAERINAVLHQAVSADAEAFRQRAAGGRTFTMPERIAAEIEATLDSFRFRQDLLRDALTTAEVAELLGTSRQAPHERLQSGGLIAVLDGGVWRFPAWQFDPEGPDRVVRGLPRVARAFEGSDLARVNWFVRPNPHLGGRTPLEALKQGDIKQAEAAARAAGNL